MKNCFFSFHFLYFFFILKLIDFTCNQNLEEYYCGKIKESDNDNNENAEENDCVCDMTIGMCDYLCCCDTDCDKSEIESWINQTKCIDQKDTVGIFADRCIDRHLVVFYNKRRGLKRENQTEDIRKIENKTILNYCFSMDNSGKMTKNITSIESYFTENGIDFNEETIQVIGDSIYNITFKIENNLDQNSDQSDNQNEENTKKYIKFDSTYDKNNFKKSDFFSLYSSSSCQNSKNVELFKSENYSCIMNTGFSITEDNLTSIKFESKKSTECSILNRYCVNEEGLLTYNAQSQCLDGTIIVEVEFLLKIEETEIKDCSINIVRAPNDGNFRIFKNSAIFTNIKNTIPYRYSGNGGYLNNFPLKVYSANKNKVFNEFFIVGRNRDGDCRYDPETDIYNYLYNIDKPLYFKQDYTYSCKLDNNHPLKSTTLYQKISDITKIAKYGSSSYINADKEDNPDWITVDKSNLNENDKYIIMNVYIKKKKQGFYSFKVIDKVIIKSKDNSVDSELKFDIKFEDSDDENNESKYNKDPEKPLFIPNIPEDILDPLFYSDVDK